ncbi:type I restriction-modification system subunit M [Massilia sp. W12]|uniref:type I restriction-modification system subunit M n=1 Tax=Massilia sp. W12 TaxID=3126507 RepID=UPI0030D396F7
MAIKKSELYSSLWASCDELRGGMDASQYKDYVLALLFIKYVSDKYAGQRYASVIVPEGANFKDMVALKGSPHIGEYINTKVIAPLEKANRISIKADFNKSELLGDGKEKIDRLTKLVAIFERPELDFSKNRAEGDDILGDAYEYLMQHFAKDSGKSKGQFYTPAEVSRIMAKVIGIGSARTSSSTTVYDPTCGSGSLLLKVADEAPTPVSLYGQEKDEATSGLAYMNMVLHNMPTATIVQGNTLTTPLFKENGSLKTFDYVVANPPFSDKAWSNGMHAENDEFDRFSAFGIPPAKQGDFAYLLHIVRSLKPNGKGACILPHGVLFRGNAEADIRKNLIRRGLIKGIIGLPANLFFGTGIPACIIVLDKEDAQARKSIFMIDASAGFMKDGPKNRLREQDLHKIVDVFTRQDESDPSYARRVSLDEIEKNDFNLNLPRYIDSAKAEDVQDIAGHLQGGIPAADIQALQAYWDVCPQLQATLFAPRREGYFDLALEIAQIKPGIYHHPEFAAYIAGMNTHFEHWRQTAEIRLKSLQAGFKPKALIVEVAEGLLAHYADRPLINAYDVYQHLLDYWAETMQDDCYQIAAEGWVAKPQRVFESKKSKDGKESKQIDRGWACDLLPKPLIVARYFAAKQREIDALAAKQEEHEAALTELIDEHSSEGGALQDVENRADASKAQQEAVLALWRQADGAGFMAYASAQMQLETLQDAQSALEAGPAMQRLGRISQAAVSERLCKNIGDEERSALETWRANLAAIKLLREKLADGLSRARNHASIRIAQEPEHEDLRELQALNTYLHLQDEIAHLKKQIKDKDKALDKLAHDKYADLTEDDIKDLVVRDKWLAQLDRDIHGEMDRVSQALAQRVKELAQRYGTSLPEINAQVAEMEAQVNAHLAKMGFVW